MGSEIDKHKRRARALYREMQSELDTVDCGISLLSFIRPSFGKTVSAYDAEIAWLRANDPEFPK